jgi:hypothetical protein
LGAITLDIRWAGFRAEIGPELRLIAEILDDEYLGAVD